MIKTITQQLFELGNLELLPEVSDSTGKYHMKDDGGVEAETGEFLHGLVRVLQPENILTTGIYSGISDMYLAQALKDNGHGNSVACEYDESHIARSKELWMKVGIAEIISVFHGSSLDYKPDRQYELIFSDTEPAIRFQELMLFFPYLKEGGYFLIHDLHRHLSQEPNEQFFGWPFGKLPDEVVRWIKEDKLRVISFPTPRGLSGFYKPTEKDYRP